MILTCLFTSIPALYWYQININGLYDLWFKKLLLNYQLKYICSCRCNGSGSCSSEVVVVVIVVVIVVVVVAAAVVVVVAGGGGGAAAAVVVVIPSSYY